MRYASIVSVVIAAVLLSACSAYTATGRSKNVIVDTKGVNMARYEQDKLECEEYASQVNVGEQTAVSAAAGAVVGGAVGAVVGNSDSAKRGASVGAIGGGVRGYDQATREQQMVIRNCLRGRGYRVLN